MLSAKPWKLPGLMWLMMCLLVGIASFALVLTIIAQATGQKPDADTPVLLIIRTLALDGSILIAIFFFLRLEHVSCADAFGFNTRPVWRAVLWGVIAGVCFTPIGQEMNELCARALQAIHVQPQSEQAVETLQKAAPGFNRIYLAFFAIVIAPVAEETLFRGILYPTIKQCGFPRLALWGTSVLFAAIHLNLPAFVPLVLFAALLAFLYEKTNNLLACILAHGIFNASAVIYMFCFVPANPVTHPPY